MGYRVKLSADSIFRDLDEWNYPHYHARLPNQRTRFYSPPKSALGEVTFEYGQKAIASCPSLKDTAKLGYRHTAREESILALLLFSPVTYQIFPETENSCQVPKELHFHV